MNKRINVELDKHTIIYKWTYRLAHHYELRYEKLRQYVNGGHQNDRTTSEILKNELLSKVWDWMDIIGPRKNWNDELLLRGMKYCAIALKGDEDRLLKILKRKHFWISE